MNTITARVVRDGRWWGVEIPYNGSTQYTQGRTLAEAQSMAEDLVAMWAKAIDDPDLAAAKVTLQVAGEVEELIEQAQARRVFGSGRAHPHPEDQGHQRHGAA